MFNDNTLYATCVNDEVIIINDKGIIEMMFGKAKLSFEDVARAFCVSEDDLRSVLLAEA